MDMETFEMQMKVVQQNAGALEYVKEQTPELCMVAMQQDKEAAQFVKDPQMLEKPPARLFSQQEMANATTCLRETPIKAELTSAPAICLER